MALRIPLVVLAVLAAAAPAAALPLGLDHAVPDAAAPLVDVVEAALPPVVVPSPVEPLAAPVMDTLGLPPDGENARVAASGFPSTSEEDEGHDEPAPRARRERGHDGPGFLDALPTFPPLPSLPTGPDLTPVFDPLRFLPPAPPLPGAAPQGPAPSAPPAAPAPAPAHDAPPASLGVAALAVGLAATAAAPAVAFGWDRLRRWGFLAVLYARIAKERLLDHGARERLLEQARLTPGAPLADLARAADIPRNTAVYHLRRLEKEGLLSSIRQGRVRLYFAPGSQDERENADALAALRHPTTRSIATEIGSAPGLDQTALCARTGLAPSLAHWHASRLADAGVVERRREGRHVRYYPGPAMRLLG